MFRKLPESAGNFVGYEAKGKLTQKDYEDIGPELDRLVEEHGKLRILVDLQAFEGIDAGALGKEFQIDMKHRNNIEKLAVVGDKKWEEWMTALSRPFISGEAKYFDASESESAKSWVLNGHTVATAEAQ